MARQKIPSAWFGVGLMGEGVRTPADRGRAFAVVGFDVDPAKTARLAEIRRPAGRLDRGAGAPPPTRSCWPCSTPTRSEQVVEKDLLPALGAAASTSGALRQHLRSPTASRRWRRRVRKQGLKFLETPVSGTSEQVRQG